MNAIDKFIEEQFILVDFENLSPAEQYAHNKHMAVAIRRFMEFICAKRLDMIEAEPIVKKKGGGSRRNPLRNRPDGTYDNGPLDPDYNRKYYEQNIKGLTVSCPSCGSTLLKSNLSKHKKSLKCIEYSKCVEKDGKPSEIN
jgi:hypothetical protein